MDGEKSFDMKRFWLFAEALEAVKLLIAFLVTADRIYDVASANPFNYNVISRCRLQKQLGLDALLIDSIKHN